MWPCVVDRMLKSYYLFWQHGGDIRKRHSTTGESVLHIAAKMGHTEITAFLLNFCRQSHPNMSPCRPSRKLIDINITDTNNRTPLQVAAEKGQCCCCSYLRLLCFLQTMVLKYIAAAVSVFSAFPNNGSQVHCCCCCLRLLCFSKLLFTNTVENSLLRFDQSGQKLQKWLGIWQHHSGVVAVAFPT